MTIDECISFLLAYAERQGLVQAQDRSYTANRLLEVLGLDGYTEVSPPQSLPKLSEILEAMIEDALGRGLLCNNTITQRDIFDTKITACLTPPPSVITERFWKLHASSPAEATEYFYRLGIDTNYIRSDRIKKDLKWQTQTEYGALDITINLSKPEKDPAEIAAAKKAQTQHYPACQLCRENEGYNGRTDHPARGNLRIIPLTIYAEDWGFQYSPYVYYNEHCIVLNMKHTPMVIDRSVFHKLIDFVGQFPHYFLGSNADLPIVGGSILSHEHFQGGNYEFPMARAPSRSPIRLTGFEGTEAAILHWPMSVIRLRDRDPQRIAEAAAHVLAQWKGYTDEKADILAHTGAEAHNTITPIARKRENTFELDLVLRNNRTTKAHPLGIFHPHEDLHHIKKENIGLIEVMGLAVLPSRLKTELLLLAPCLLGLKDAASDERTAKHAPWIGTLIQKYRGTISSANAADVLRKETGLVFLRVLEDAGVFKQTESGMEAFIRFCKRL